MKVLAVYLLADGRREPAPVALFPWDHFEQISKVVKRYLDLFHPGRSYELEELDVSVRPPERP